MTPDGHWFRAAFVVGVVFVVHEAVLRGLRIDGVRPDLLLGVGVVAALVGGPEAGAVVAFVAALLGDLFVNTPFGLSALVACVVAFLAGAIRGTLGTANRWALPLLTAAASFVGEVLWAVVGTVLGLPGLLHPHLAVVAGVVAGVNVIAAFPLAASMRWVFQPRAEGSFAT